LDQDIDQAERDCRRIFGDELWQQWGETRRAGWVNFVFNLGLPRAMSFHRTIKAAKEGNWERVRQGLENSLWAVQVKSRAKRVIDAVCSEVWGWG
jgi:GH24 family phage-related lysozyme (muramidase)